MVEFNTIKQELKENQKIVKFSFKYTQEELISLGRDVNEIILDEDIPKYKFIAFNETTKEMIIEFL